MPIPIRRRTPAPVTCQYRIAASMGRRGTLPKRTKQWFDTADKAPVSIFPSTNFETIGTISTSPCAILSIKAGKAAIPKSAIVI